MPPTTPRELPPRIQRLSQLLAGACLVLMVLLPPMLAVYWAVTDTATLAVRANLTAAMVLGELQPWQRVAAGLSAEIPLCLLLVGLAHARRCFRLFATGRIFNAQTMFCLRRFSAWTTASALGSMVCGTLNSVLLTWHNPPGARHLSIGIGSDQILLLLFSAMVWLMAAVISQGQALADENAQFI